MSANTNQKYTTSTYLIDASKKIYVGGATAAGTFPDNAPGTLQGISVFAAGIIDDKALSNLGFEYKEGFKSGKKVAEDRFEDVVKPATMAIKALTGALPIMKGISNRIDKAEKLRTTAIEGYTLLAGTTTLLGGNTDTSVTKQLENWQAVYQYDPPVRKAPPTVDLQSNQIDITFRYGACNVFDAYWEVYYPITRIYESIFPQAIASSNAGLATYNKQFNVPYEQQVFVQLLKNILPVDSTDKGTYANKEGTNNIFTSLKNLASAKSTLDREADLFEQRKNNLINGLDSSLSGLKIKDVISRTGYENSIKTKIFDAVGLNNVSTTDIKDALSAGDTEGSLYTAISGLIETAIEEKKLSGDVLITDGKWKGGNNGVLDKVGGWFTGDQSLDRYLPDDSGGIKVVVKPKSTSDKASTLKSVFDSLVTFEPRIIGQTLANIYSTWVQNCCSKIYFGFPCVYGRSLSDFKSTIYSNPGSYAKIKIQNIVLGNVAINFNFSNTDERGYPLEGHVILKGMWNCSLPQNVLSFAGGIDGDSPKNHIKMEEQT